MEASDCHWFSQLVPDSVKIGCVDWCIDAMERGALSVCFRNSDGYYLWENFVLSISHWVRLCRLRPPVCDLWGIKSTIELTRYDWGAKWTGDDPDAIATLVQMEYLWTDLDAVDKFCHLQLRRRVAWIADEVNQRRRWAAGLRRAWLAAVVSVQ